MKTEKPLRVHEFGDYTFEEYEDRLRIRVTEYGKDEIRRRAVGYVIHTKLGVPIVYDFDTEKWRVRERITDEEILENQMGFGVPGMLPTNIDSQMEFLDFIEEARGNGWDEINPGTIMAMTDATILTYGGDSSDEAMDKYGGTVPYPGEPVYWHRRYMVESPLREMLERGYVDFDKAEED